MGSFTKMQGSDWAVRRVGNIDITYLGTHKPSLFTNMLVAELALRETVQREEMLQYKIQALQKAAAIESSPEGKAKLAEVNDELDEIRVQLWRNRQALYRAEASFPPIEKNYYNTLRTDDHWYMREEMVQDCAAKGGCCSRGCGCCSRRTLSQRPQGIGHCTSECWCCSGQRGFEISCEEKQEIRDNYKEMLGNRDKVFLNYSVNCFVSPLKHQVPSKSLHSKFVARWRLIFS